MYHFFVEENQISESHIDMLGDDVNHAMNVLRLGVDEQVVLCDQKGIDYKCSIESLTKERIRCKILSKEKSISELPVRISLFQGAPKQDKMESIIMKSVELGVCEITPIYMKRSIVKYDDKKEAKKTERWQSISLGAAKQSKRGIVPKVCSPLSFREFMKDLSGFDLILVPYENERGMDETRKVISSIQTGMRIAIVIGPEGGFDESEIHELQQQNARIITLGNRILRTETASPAILAMITYQIEEVLTWQ
ncbi:MAG: 16S rRNA (uracil(1498)-N(3))-methyltransferase [Vallitaleaceae bacterium]|nr:16S rRNA (uracil(1498)-N(3))-methyltransferase [Vallitaleaceae bacterium]